MLKSNRVKFFALLTCLIFGAIYFYLARPKASRPLNLILISLDTLRADRLGTYGYSRDTSPFLDSMAAKSVVFEHAVTTAPWTLPAHVSLLTGLYPSSHGVTLRKGQTIGSSTELMAETLKQAGYQTIAYVGGGYVSERYGFDRGFDVYHSNRNERTSENQGFQKTIELASKKLKQLDSDKPFFLFLHTYTVHCPYNPPEPYFSKFASKEAEAVDPNNCGKELMGFDDFNRNKALYLSDRYDGSISFLDSMLKDFFRFLEQQGLLEDSLVIITSDHGDEFFEHGKLGHGNSLFKELLMVPLIISGPDFSAKRVSDPVSLVDIFPTVLES